MKDGQYIHIEGWMGKRLQLRANELICFAVIYGFSMDGESQFKGNLIYLSECMFATQPTVLSSLKKLLECNLILKQDDVVKGKKRCYYSTNIIFENGGFIVVDTTKEPLVMTTKEPLVMTTKEPLVMTTKEPLVMTTKEPLVDTYNNKKDNNKEKRLSNDNQKNKRFIKPTVEDIQAYIDEKKLSFDAERFFDYYESKGWLVGKSPMKDWKAACRTWENMRKSEIMKEEKEESAEPEMSDTEKETWLKCQNWMSKKTPRLKDRITYDDFCTMRSLSHFKAGIYVDIIMEIEKSGYDGNIVDKFDKLCQEKYYHRIWENG